MSSTFLNLTDVEVLNYFHKFKKQVELKDRKALLGMKTYLNCFVGREATNILMSLFNLEKQRALELGQLFMDKGLFVHVTHQCKEFKDKKDYYYKFTNHKRASRRLTGSHKATESSEQTSPIASLPSSPSESYTDIVKQATEKKITSLVNLGKKLFSKTKLNDDGNTYVSPNNIPTLSLDSLTQNQNYLPTCSPKTRKFSLSSPRSRPSTPRITPRSATAVIPNSKKPSLNSPHSPKDMFEQFVQQHKRLEEGGHHFKALQTNYICNYGITSSANQHNQGDTSPPAREYDHVYSSSLPSLSSDQGKFLSSSLSSSPTLGSIAVKEKSRDDVDGVCRSYLTFKVNGNYNVSSMAEEWEETKHLLQSYISQLTIDEVLENDELREILKQFAKEEFAEENILFWEQVRDFKQIPTSALHKDELIEKAHNIYKKFIVETGEYALNINQKIITECTNMFLTSKTSKMFNNVSVEVKHALSDLLDRFKMSLQQQQ